MNKIAPLPTHESCLLQEIRSQMQIFKNMERPLKASEMTTTISTQKLMEIMAYAELELMYRVTEQRDRIERARICK